MDHTNEKKTKLLLTAQEVISILTILKGHSKRGQLFYIWVKAFGKVVGRFVGNFPSNLLSHFLIRGYP